MDPVFFRIALWCVSHMYQCRKTLKLEQEHGTFDAIPYTKLQHFQEHLTQKWPRFQAELAIKREKDAEDANSLDNLSGEAG
ncbi:hypothetical protein Tco_1298624, partial [Tanacetum coccineum]